MSISAEVTFDPKIKNADDAKKWMTNFITHPPETPLEAVKMFADVSGVGGTITAGLTAAVPALGMVLPILSGILDLFGGGGPSIGQITLEAIGQLGKQINAVAEKLQKALTFEIEKSAQKVIDVVLQGQTEIAREQSAALAMTSAIEASILDEAAAQKNEIYAQFLAETEAAQTEAMQNLQAMLAKAQETVNQYYDTELAQIVTMLAELVGPFLAELEKYITAQKMQMPVTASRSAAAPIKTESPPVIPEGQNNMIYIIAATGLLFILMKRKKN